MRKNVDKDTAGNLECLFNAELLFCSDATVVDYLNALLESEPALKMDFKEIHFVHQEVNSNSNTTAIIGNAMLFNAEYSKTEVDELRSEIENLKFKTELAEIDAQVLRSENDKLKIAKEHLIAQLREMKGQLDSVRTENEAIRQATKTVQHRHDLPPQRVEISTENVPTEAPPLVEMAAVEEIVHDAEPIDQSELPENDLPQEPQPEPEPVSVVEERRKNYITTVLSEQEREYCSRANPPNEVVRTSNSAKKTVLSRINVAQGTPRQNVQATSKIIKHHPVEKNSLRQGHIVKRVSLAEAPQDNSGVDTRQNYVPQQYVAEVEEPLEETVAPVVIAALEPLKDVGEIEMPSAPASKVAIRRNAKYYEDVQKDSDPNKSNETSHDLVL